MCIWSILGVIFKNKNSLRTIEAQIVQKLKNNDNNEARPKFTGSYKKSVYSINKKPVYILGHFNIDLLNPRSHPENIVTRSLEGGGGSIGPPPPSTFDTIHPIDLKFGTHSKLHLYF